MAEVNGIVVDDPNDSAQDNQAQDTPSLDDVLQELAQVKASLTSMTAEKDKTKNALDKALKQNGELTKSLRAKQTAEEQQAEADKEKEEAAAAELKELVNFKNKTLAKERYLAQGMDNDTAGKAADAEISGDMDLLVSIQKQYTDALIKAKEAEWKKTRPAINAGAGDDGTSGMTQEAFNRLSYGKRVEFKNKYPDEYKKFAGK